MDLLRQSGPTTEHTGKYLLANDPKPNNANAAVPAETEPNTTKEEVLLLTAGHVPYSKAADVYPSSLSCPLPPLPCSFYGHETFVTSDPTPLVATCGGNCNKIESACYVLDLENQRWDENRMGSLTRGRWYGALAQLKDIGVYYIGGSDNEKTGADRTSDFLATGSLQWQPGPALPIMMQDFCAVAISPTSFLTVFRNKIHEFDASIAGPTSDQGWRQSTRWPTLKTSRWGQPGCAKIGSKVIITGGSNGRKLRSTEILDLASRTLSIGGDMAWPRIHFKLATLKIGGRDTVLALGGLSAKPGIERALTFKDSMFIDTVEEWLEETSSWKEAESLSRKMRFYGLATLPAELICPS